MLVHPRQRVGVRLGPHLGIDLGGDATHREVLTHPVFAHCPRREARRILRLGDVVEIPAGEQLWKPGDIGYWFLCILRGTIRIDRPDQGAATAGPGDHLGDGVILSFGPHTETATTATPVRAFVMGRRNLLGLAYLTSIRRGLGVPAGQVAYTAHIQRVRAEANEAWKRMPRRDRPQRESARFPASIRLQPSRLRRATALVVPRAAPHAPTDGQGRLVDRPIGSLGRPVAAAAGALAAAGLAFGLVYHPPLAVAVPGPPVDVAHDIRVEGVQPHLVSGRYLLLSVSFRRPNLLGVATAMLTGERVLAAPPPGAAGRVAYEAARRTFVDTRERTVRSAIASAGFDPSRVRVTVRDRPYTGASAALVYALAVHDLLDPDDHTCGRTIGVTGAISDDGASVLPVWFVAEKSKAAADAGATVLIVPSGQEPDVSAPLPALFGTRTVEEAIHWLRGAGDAACATTSSTTSSTT